MIEHRRGMGSKSMRMSLLCLAVLAVMIAPLFQQMYATPQTTEVEQQPNEEHFFSQQNNNSQIATDAWLTLELLSWQGNSSTTWDTDGTDIDPQFQVCIDLDGDLDGMSPQCEWTQIWNNTLTLSNAWNTTFDLVEENHLLNISIGCWDNDDHTDEWNNGPDACDMNPADDEWRLYYEVNWSNITTETFSGDGSIGNDTQWGNAESTWKVTVSYYGDEDNDGVSDNIDACEDTVIGDESDSAGCSWGQYDWDGDGIVNSVDQCPTSVETYCSAGNQYLPTTKVTFTNNQIAQYGEMRAWDISPDGKHLAVVVQGNSLHQQRVVGGAIVININQSFEFTKNGIGEIIADLGSSTETERQRVKFTTDGELLIRTGIGFAEFYDTETYALLSRINFPADGEHCPESTHSYRPYLYLREARISLSQDNNFAKFECPFEQKMIYVDLSKFEIVGLNDLASIESRGEFMMFDDVYPYLLTNGVIAQWHSEGFELITPNSENGLVVGLETNEIVQFSAPNDGNTLLVASHSFESPDYYSSNERLGIYNLSTGQEISIQMPNVPDENVKFKAARISQNGLTIAIFYAGQIHVYERDSDLDGFVDGDGDGIDDTDDLCPNTPDSETVGLTGCSSSQLDTDFDGIYDLLDYCPYTVANSTVDVNGCATDDIIDLDSDSDGIRDSIDQCDSSSGVVVDDSGCQISVSSSTEEIDDGINVGLWFASCCFGMLFALLMCYFGWHYYTTIQFRWAIIINIMILFIIVFSWNSLLKLSYDEDHAFQCPDGTIVTYGDSRDARGDSNLDSLEEFLENPPLEWCDESIVWLEELTDQYYAFHVAILAGIFTISNAILVYFQKSTSPFRVTLPKRKQSSSLSTPWYRNEDVWLLSFIISVIIFALLPFGTLQSNVENIPGSTFLNDLGCEEGENQTECWTDEDGYVRTATEQYQSSLFAHFFMGIIGGLIAIGIFKIDEDNGWVLLFSGLFALTSIFFALMWFYGTIALIFAEIFAANVFYLGNLLLLIGSAIAFFKTFTTVSAYINTPEVPLAELKNELWTNNKPKNKTKHQFGKGKIDHEQIKRLVRQHRHNGAVLDSYVHNSVPEPKESSLMNAIRHRRSEYQKELQSKPKSLRDQGSAPSSKPASNDTDDEIDIGSYIGLVLDDEEVYGTIVEFDDDEGLVTIEEDGTGDLVTGYQDDMFLDDDVTDKDLNKQSKNDIQSAQPKTVIKPLNTYFLNNSEEVEKPKPSKPVISEDSQGVITRRTSFSVVRIDKINQIVEKTPTKDDLNQMFIDEITTMKALDDKNIEVGLIDYELGESPKIVTRYFGSHKLADVMATANNRGKQILISELIKKVNAIHGAGWVHRDLKPDNIMVDKRPKGDHRFAEIIDYGIAMKVNRRQKEVHNTAGTAFFGHNSQKDTTFNASTGQDWFAMARIIALIIRGTDIDTLDAEINMSMNGLNLEKELTAVGFNDDQVNVLQTMISLATQHNCQENNIIEQLSEVGQTLAKHF
jgi:hypothetical protein